MNPAGFFSGIEINVETLYNKVSQCVKRFGVTVMRSEKKARAIACEVAIVLLIVIFIPKVSAAWQTSTGQIEGIRFYDRGWYLMEDDCQVDVELPYSKSVDAGIETSFYHRITPEEWGKLLYVPSFN